MDPFIIALMASLSARLFVSIAILAAPPAPVDAGSRRLVDARKTTAEPSSGVRNR
jgi:hypothetical protein